MTKTVPGFYKSPEPKKEVEMDEEELRSLFNRVGERRFLKYVREVDLVTTISGAKYVREKLTKK